MRYFYFWLQDLALTILTFNFFVRKRVIRRYTYNGKFENVLDAACGTGILVSLFSPRQYYGVDIDKDAIWYARRKHPGYQFAIGDLTDFTTTKKFDLVLVVGVLHHLSSRDVNKFLTCVSSLLKKNSKMVIVEAIYPIKKWNIPAYLLRFFDKGKFIRNRIGYKRLIEENFEIIESTLETEVVFDYAVFFAGLKENKQSLFLRNKNA